MYKKVILLEGIKFALGIDERLFIEKRSGIKAGIVDAKDKTIGHVVDVHKLKLNVAQQKIVAQAAQALTGRNFIFEDSKGLYVYENNKKKYVK